MRHFVFTLISILGLLVSMPLTAQLSATAEHLRQDYSSGYSIIRSNAVDEWKHDHKMVVYTINKESQAFVDVIKILIDAIERQDIFLYTVMVNSCIEWGNGVDFEHFDAVISSDNIFKYMLELDCKWSMVLYSINKQMENADY